MGEHLVFERYYWFDSRVRANLFPNAKLMADNFEISPRTARRNIEFMRDRLMAPLEYKPCRKGYQYTDNTFSLPPLPVLQEELISILIARDLSFPVADFREVKLKILQFGADVEVIEPKELRNEVKKEIKKMVKLYETEEF